jgi:RNA polymerase sigma factor (sigma-70 family)
LPALEAGPVDLGGVTAADTIAILAVWRIEQPRLITSLARMLRDVPLAEELTQEALLAALEHWPATGVPEKPGAWLMATAKRRALDHLRRRRMLARKHEMVALDMEQEQQAMPDLDSALDDDIGDELLRLIFTACHPLLSREARAALALRMICGLTTEEIARAFLLPDATIAQRIVRAKRTLSESGWPTRPRAARALAAALLGAGGGLSHLQRRLYRRARRGLAAAAALQRSAAHGPRAHRDRAAGARSPWAAGADGAERLARRGAHRCRGRADPYCWTRTARSGTSSRSAAGCRRSAGADARRRRRLYALQAAIVACHAQAETADDTDWPRIASLYAELAALVRSPVIELNRAVAVGMAEGPEAALAIVDRLAHEPRSNPITCCRAFAATCCKSSAATRRPAPPSKRPPR